MSPRRRREHDELGQVTVLIVGFAGVLAMLVAAVVDASAAYLRHEALDAVADGAALAAADGIEGRQVYEQGLADGAAVDPALARALVADYLVRSGATARYPGLRWAVAAEGDRVVVRVQAPLDLPLRPPGVAGGQTVGTTAASFVQVSP